MGIRLQSVQIITMKFLVVVLVLAIAALAQAEPEADPGVLYGAYYGHPHFYGRYGYGSHYGFYNGFYARSAYGYGLPGHSYTHVDRLHKREADAQVPALPLVYANTAFPYATAPAAFAGVINPYVYNPVPVATAPVAPILPYAGTIPTAAGVAVAARPFTPYDCVTSDGCAVRALKEAGLAKREADPEAEAEAAYYYGNYYNYGYNPYYNYYNGFYNYPYSNYYGAYRHPYAYNPYVPYVAAAPVAAEPAEEAEPVEVKADPVPVVAAPYYYNTPAVVAPAPVAKVVKAAKPVTYTHLGAHPIQPTTVLEETSQIVY